MGSDPGSRLRAEVIERFINIAAIVNAIICQHYFRRVNLMFYLQVLYDEYFSFGLKRRIVSKIIDNPDKKKLDDLGHANTIRNYFAHCGQRMVGYPTPGAAEQVVDPRKITEAVDFEELHREFMDIAGGIEEYLFGVYREKGGQAEKGPESDAEKRADRPAGPDPLDGRRLD